MGRDVAAGGLADGPAAAAKPVSGRLTSAGRFRWEKRFWLVMCLPVAIWLKESVLYVALVSNYALYTSLAAAEEAAEARAEAKE